MPKFISAYDCCFKLITELNLRQKCWSVCFRIPDNRTTPDNDTHRIATSVSTTSNAQGVSTSTTGVPQGFATPTTHAQAATASPARIQGGFTSAAVAAPCVSTSPTGAQGGATSAEPRRSKPVSRKASCKQQWILRTNVVHCLLCD